MTYEKHCGLRQPSFFGQVKDGFPVSSDPQVVPDRVVFPETYRGLSSPPTPLTVRNRGTSPLPVSTPVPGDSSVRVIGDDCPDVLPAGDSCAFRHCAPRWWSRA